jgi:hypothetical protein
MMPPLTGGTNTLEYKRIGPVRGRAQPAFADPWTSREGTVQPMLAREEFFNERTMRECY